jgi:thiol:disulfide interchange protein DsbD
VTVTFMGGAAGGSRRRALTLSLVYVAGLACVYSVLGVASALAGKTFGQVTRSAWVYGPVALLMIALGLVMLGWLPLRIPAFFGGVQQHGARRGGHLGALLMGVAAGFVAAPCTAPVLGFLLIYVARTHDVVWGGVLMLAFSAGLGLLLLLLGVFSGLVSSLPRAGRWMATIKNVFGVGMLLVGGWFLWVAVSLALASPASSP